MDETIDLQQEAIRRDGVANSTALEPPVTVIEARLSRQMVEAAELWRYRELLYFLTWRDIKVRYKQTVLGAAWAVLQPAAMMIVFSLFFGRVAHVPSAEVSYPLFVLCGLLPRCFFAKSFSSAAACC